MADLTITNTNVVPDAENINVQQVIAGEVIDAGEMVYLDSTDANKAKLAEAGDTQAKANVLGMALSDAVAAGQKFLVAKTGSEIAIGTGAAGQVYVLSTTAGKIALESDIGSGNYLTIIGYGTATANEIMLAISATGIPHA